MSAPRIAASIDVSLASAKPATATSFIRRVQLNQEDLKNPQTMLLHFRRMQAELDQTTQAARSHPIQAPFTFRNVSCGSSGKVRLSHNFGRFVDFLVIRWAGASTSAGPGLVSDELDGAAALSDLNNLYLKSSVVGVANIMVF